MMSKPFSPGEKNLCGNDITLHTLKVCEQGTGRWAWYARASCCSCCGTLGQSPAPGSHTVSAFNITYTMRGLDSVLVP